MMASLTSYAPNAARPPKVTPARRDGTDLTKDQGLNQEQYSSGDIYLFLTKPMMPPVATRAPKAYPATSCFFMSPMAIF